MIRACKTFTCNPVEKYRSPPRDPGSTSCLSRSCVSPADRVPRRDRREVCLKQLQTIKMVAEQNFRPSCWLCVSKRYRRLKPNPPRRRRKPRGTAEAHNQSWPAESRSDLLSALTVAQSNGLRQSNSYVNDCEKDTCLRKKMHANSQTKREKVSKAWIKPSKVSRFPDLNLDRFGAPIA